MSNSSLDLVRRPRLGSLVARRLSAFVLIASLAAALLVPSQVRRQVWEGLIITIVCIGAWHFTESRQWLRKLYRIPTFTPKWFDAIERSNSRRLPFIYKGLLTDLTDRVLRSILTILIAVLDPGHFYTRLSKVIGGRTLLLRPIPFSTSSAVFVGLLYWFLEEDSFRALYSIVLPALASSLIVAAIISLLRALQTLLEDLCPVFQGLRVIPIDLRRSYPQSTFPWSIVYCFVGLIYSLPVLWAAFLIATSIADWLIEVGITPFGATTFVHLVFGLFGLRFILRPVLCHMLAPLTPVGNVWRIDQFAERVWKALLIRRKGIEEITRSPSATLQALWLVFLVIILRQFAANPIVINAMNEQDWARLFGALFGGSLVWFECWLLIVASACWIGGTVFHGTEMEDSFRQLVRGQGFAFSGPLTLYLFAALILGYMPGQSISVWVLEVVLQLTVSAMSISTVMNLTLKKSVATLILAMLAFLGYWHLMVKRVLAVFAGMDSPD